VQVHHQPRLVHAVHRPGEGVDQPHRVGGHVQAARWVPTAGAAPVQRALLAHPHEVDRVRVRQHHRVDVPAPAHLLGRTLGAA
jgi:hypothetical protein